MDNSRNQIWVLLFYRLLILFGEIFKNKQEGSYDHIKKEILAKSSNTGKLYINQYLRIIWKCPLFTVVHFIEVSY